MVNPSTLFDWSRLKEMNFGLTRDFPVGPITCHILLAIIQAYMDSARYIHPYNLTTTEHRRRGQLIGFTHKFKQQPNSTFINQLI